MKYLWIPLVSILLFESVLQFTPLHDKFVKPQLYPISKGGRMVPDPVAGYDMAENLPNTPYWIRDTKLDFWTDWMGTQGYGDGVSSRPAVGGRDYILLVGDSFTWAYGPFEKKFGTVLEREIDFPIIKAGVSGYGTKQELMKAKKIVRKVGKAPKLIIVGYLFNDFMDDHFFPSFNVINGYIVPTTKNINPETYEFERKTEAEMRQEIENFERYGDPKGGHIGTYILNKITKYTVLGAIGKEAGRLVGFATASGGQEKPKHPAFHAYTPIDRSPRLAKAWTAHLANIQAFQDYANEIGAELLIAGIPVGELVYSCLDRPSPDLDYHQPFRIVGEFCRTNGIYFIDLASRLRPYADQSKTRQGAFDPNVDFFWKIDGHLSPAGNEMVGKLLAKYIKEEGILK